LFEHGLDDQVAALQVGALAVGVMRRQQLGWSCGPMRPLSTRACVSLAL
jgi:hypothetical protein